MRIGCVLVGACALGISLTAFAEGEQAAGWTFIPSIGYQHKQLDFSQSYTDDVSLPANENGRKSDFSVYLPTVNLSLTTAYKKIYAAFKYEQSLTEGSVEVDETRPPTLSGQWDAYYLNVPGHETKVERDDKSITIGMNVWGAMNVFAGYMEGKTKLTPEPSCTFPAACSALNNAVDLENEGRGEYRQVYTEKGPYIGASYGWQIANAGTLSASFAYARMDGEFRDNYRLNSGDKHFNFVGDSVGTSIGVTWTAPLGDSSVGFIDLRQQKYSMDGKSHTTFAKFDKVEVQTDETMLGLTMGVQLFF